VSHRMDLLDCLDHAAAGGEIVDPNAMIRSAAARIRELEERLHERDLAVAEMSKKRAEAYRRGDREGIERVRMTADRPWCGCSDGLSIEDTCDAALAAYEEEVGRE
jgi:hypothetical protein